MEYIKLLNLYALSGYCFMYLQIINYSNNTFPKFNVFKKHKIICADYNYLLVALQITQSRTLM